MGDDKLRKIERRWHESNLEEDEALLLTERIRTGNLSITKLELLAYCGYRPAIIAIGPNLPDIPNDLLDWISYLKKWGKEAGVRAAIAYAKSVYKDWKSLDIANDAPELAIKSAEDWLISPTKQNEQMAHLAAQSAWRCYKENCGFTNGADAAASACHAAESVTGDADFAIGVTIDAVRDGPLMSLMDEEKLQEEARIRSLVSAALINWALCTQME